MGTGACGIDCSVCKLHVTGACSSCGSGLSEDGRNKRQAQLKLFGMACSMLECAIKNEISYCMRDCTEFPCKLYSQGPYPFSDGFLQMQKRRMEQHHSQKHPKPTGAQKLMWEELAGKSKAATCERAAVSMLEAGGFILKSLGESWTINITEKKIRKSYGKPGGEWDRLFPPLVLVYLLRTLGVEPSEKMVAPRDVIPGRDFFGGLHSLKTSAIAERFEDDPEGFKKVGQELDGRVIDHGDAAFIVDIFPKLPVEYILWTADDEFPARINILLPENTTDLYPIDACEKAINLLNERIVLIAKDYL